MKPFATKPSIVVDPKLITPLIAVGLKCMDCAAFQVSEVRQCTLTDCGLYPVRLRGIRAWKKCWPDRPKKDLPEGWVSPLRRNGETAADEDFDMADDSEGESQDEARDN